MFILLILFDVITTDIYKKKITRGGQNVIGGRGCGVKICKERKTGETFCVSGGLVRLWRGQTEVLSSPGLLARVHEYDT